MMEYGWLVIMLLVAAWGTYTYVTFNKMNRRMDVLSIKFNEVLRWTDERDQATEQLSARLANFQIAVVGRANERDQAMEQFDKRLADFQLAIESLSEVYQANTVKISEVDRRMVYLEEFVNKVKDDAKRLREAKNRDVEAIRAAQARMAR